MRKVVIIGAGHVGSHCGYTLAHSGITDEIVLVDVDKDKAYAQALDIADSVSFCERETVVRSGDYKDCEDAAIVVIAIGEARKPGQTRLDMLGRSDFRNCCDDYKSGGYCSGFCKKGAWIRAKQSIWHRNFA